MKVFLALWLAIGFANTHWAMPILKQINPEVKNSQLKYYYTAGTLLGPIPILSFVFNALIARAKK